MCLLNGMKSFWIFLPGPFIYFSDAFWDTAPIDMFLVKDERLSGLFF
jgi:hypothetical protein